MLLRRCVVFWVCGIVGTAGWAQPKPDISYLLLGTWVVGGSVLKSRIEDPLVSTYRKYTFTKNNIAYYATNEIERGVKQAYFVDGNSINLQEHFYNIVSVTPDEIRLSDESATEITLVRKKKYDSLLESIRTLKSDAGPTLPVFLGEFYLHPYFFSKVTTPEKFESNFQSIMRNRIIQSNLNEDSYLRVKMEIDSVGNASMIDVIGWKHFTKKQLLRLKEKVESTSGYWTPAMENGKKINYQLDLTFTIQGFYSRTVHRRVTGLVIRAYRNYQKKYYDRAIILASKAIDLEREQFDFYLLRAACYLSKQETQKYCDDLIKASFLNPLIRLDNIEIVDGVPMKIQCIRK